MKTAFTSLLLLLAVSAGAQRIVTNFDKDWKFFLGDDSDAQKPVYREVGMRVLNLPHDWSIEGKFSELNPAKPEGGGLPAGIGWYRKTFLLPDADRRKNVSIEFDGVYRNSAVWVNGHYLGGRPNGYISFQYDLTPYLQFGDRPNEISVRVDNSAQPNSRWYSGSGIYRHVRLVATSKVAIDHWGTFITTPETDAKHAVCSLQTKIRKTTVGDRKVNLVTVIFDAKNQEATRFVTQNILLKDSLTEINQQLTVPQPRLWSVGDPYLYRAVTKIVENGAAIDDYATSFGIRSFYFDAAKGFFLNGQPLKILGVCNHHDLGALGAAVNTRAMERQLEILKKMGCNAIRSAHNPPAPELLDLCDRMGFLVMDEAFDMWEKKKNKQDYHLDFAQWHERDLRDQVLRDRNHPSVFMWSIGNEIREQFDSTGITIAQELAGIVRSLDNTRPVTSALSENDPKKNFIYKSGALDVVGLNYHQESYKDFPKNYPGQKFIGSETMSALESRGHYDKARDTTVFWPANAKEKYTKGNVDFTVSAYDNVAAYWGSTHETTWKIIKKYDYLSGLFIWTGFDYLGEPTPYPWPARSSYFGIIDLAGFPKDVYYMYQSEWTQTPVLHLLPHWNWKMGKTVDVWAYYNQADEVELYLNGKSLGKRSKRKTDLHVSWKVKFEPGTLKAVSRKNGRTVLEQEIKTAGQPAKIELIADRKSIKADGEDLSFITVRILDKDGNLVPDASNLVRFRIKGAGKLAGVDNGYQAGMDSFKEPFRKAFNGMCLAIVQSTTNADSIELIAESDGLECKIIKLESK